MPAETHQHSGEVTVTDVLELFGAVLGLSDDIGDRSLVELGCDDDLTLLDLWEAGIEEYGERTVAEIDVDELRATHTLAALARLVVAACRASVVDDEPEVMA